MTSVFITVGGATLLVIVLALIFAKRAVASILALASFCLMSVPALIFAKRGRGDKRAEELRFATVTDAEGRPLQIRLVNESGTQGLNDANLKDYPGLEHLEKLDLCMTDVTDKGLAALSVCQNLRELHLSSKLISDEGMKEVARLNTLRLLTLTQTRVTDVGLGVLAGMKHLEELHLGWSPVTDVGIARLGQIPSLRKLELHDTQVTAIGVAKLNEALPACDVSCS